MAKLCCVNCFTYQTLQEFIKQNGIGREYCDFCENNSIYCIEPSQLSTLFDPIISLYTPIVEFMPMELMKSYEGDNIAEKIDIDWQVFNHDSFTGEGILEAMYGSYDPYENEGIDLESWVENIDLFWGSSDEPSEVLHQEWDDFREELLYQNRYFLNKSVRLDVLLYFPILETELNEGIYLYRARKTSTGKIPPRKMGAPPAKLSQAGRANPKGIPYLYLASDMQTAIHEIRPSTKDKITVGRFKLLRKLKILNLASIAIKDPFKWADDLRRILRHLSFFRTLGKELSKPIRPEDKDLDYIPTQYLCEFIKTQGYDGVAYKSGVSDGVNYALFNESGVKCTRSKLYKINANPVEDTPYLE